LREVTLDHDPAGIAWLMVQFASYRRNPQRTWPFPSLLHRLSGKGREPGKYILALVSNRKFQLLKGKAFVPMRARRHTG
jgi:hypothetical protein